MTDDALLAAARDAAERAYAPYSGFRVGAALAGEDGLIHTGSNVENAAFPSGTCAEATAVNHAVSTGVRRIETVAVACIDATGVEQAMPCGRCRQIMNEFGVRRVLVTSGDGAVGSFGFEELFPHPFRI